MLKSGHVYLSPSSRGAHRRIFCFKKRLILATPNVTVGIHIMLRVSEIESQQNIRTLFEDYAGAFYAELHFTY